MPTHVVIIGAGPAGEAAASALRRLDKSVSVTLVEKDRAGGLCLNRGCIPSKTLLEQVHKVLQAKRPVVWSDLQKFKTDVVTGIRTALESRLKREGVNLVQGTARFTGPQTLQVGTQEILFDKAIVATGTEVYFPTPLDQHKKDLLTSDSLLTITTTPKSILVVGGGAVGCEFACLLNAAGSQVTILEMKDTLLPGEDAAVTSLLQQSLETRGIQVKTGTVVESLEKSSSGWAVKLKNGEKIDVEQVLACVGRIPSPHELDLEKANVKTEKARIVTNETLQTSNPNIFAIGDAAGTRLAHHAAAQGEVAAANVLGKKETCDDRLVPRCLYSWPEVASVGAWKYQLEEAGKPVKASRSFFKGSAKALASGESEGFVQVVSEPESGKILGAQIIGAHATELIHIFSVALVAGMTLKDLSRVMFAHPTLSELIKEAVRK